MFRGFGILLFFSGFWFLLVCEDGVDNVLRDGQ